LAANVVLPDAVGPKIVSKLYSGKLFVIISFILIYK